MTLRPGTLVRARNHGIGEVIVGWGSFLACRNCFARLSIDSAYCPDCLKSLPDYFAEEKRHWEVPGSGVYEIQFAHGVECINEAWLKLAEDLSEWAPRAEVVLSDELPRRNAGLAVA